ncbi:GlsB/YeaQ/YmgE family stress response membrane protein [Rhodococcus sp. MALMAid1271]|uniref:GlsB/YeaQ/YmgE family stress response membrane protein n=1 Tax=Rhodococcus sp. MALMAid1271 TaxID=3411744 RepID=UPI003B9EF969
MWAFIVYIIIGGIAGWVASKIMKTDAQMGIILNIVVGVIGGLLGGWVLRLFTDVDGSGLWATFFICLLGAVILLFLVKLVTGRSRV